MKKSRKRKSRSAIRKQLRLKEQRQRVSPRSTDRYPVQKSAAVAFLKNHVVEAALLMLAVLGVTSVIWFGSNRRTAKEIRTAVSDIVKGQDPIWRQAYPFGYKVIVLTEKDIIHTLYDTLPKDLRIDWGQFSAVRIEADRFKGADEKIRLAFGKIDYAPAAVSGLSVGATFTRKKGITTRLVSLGSLNFIAEIVDDKEGQVFCLLGLVDALSPSPD